MDKVHIESTALPGYHTLFALTSLKVLLKGLFHPACLARVVSLFASVAAIFMVHENGDEQRQAKR